MEQKKFKTLEDLSAAAAKEISALADSSIKKRGFFTIALSGGTTPRETYKILAGEYADKIDWQNTHVFLSDERDVPFDSEDSNFESANELLLSRVEIPTENIYRYKTELGIDRAVEDYETAILDFFQSRDQTKPSFDLIMLGLGEDGHFASLFPGSEALKEKFNLVAKSASPDGMQRATFTLPLINQAESILMLVGSGKEKALKKFDPKVFGDTANLKMFIQE